MTASTPTRVVVLVRGINVGRAKQVAMGDLAAALRDVGGAGVRTYLRSGNAVMDVALPAGRGSGAAARTTAAVAALGAAAQEALLARSGVSARVLVVTAGELAVAVAANPFPDLVDTPKQLHVAFCESRPDPGRLEALGLRHGDDEIGVGDRVLYLAYRSGSSLDSPITTVVGRVGVTVTVRNWSTVGALARLCDA
jgi:uncharacterized protein (DUF1697 family)